MLGLGCVVVSTAWECELDTILNHLLGRRNSVYRTVTPVSTRYSTSTVGVERNVVRSSIMSGVIDRALQCGHHPPGELTGGVDRPAAGVLIQKRPDVIVQPYAPRVVTRRFGFAFTDRCRDFAHRGHKAVLFG
jgi:hypothetical protein